MSSTVVHLVAGYTSQSRDLPFSQAPGKQHSVCPARALSVTSDNAATRSPLQEMCPESSVVSLRQGGQCGETCETYERSPGQENDPSTTLTDVLVHSSVSNSTSHGLPGCPGTNMEEFCSVLPIHRVHCDNNTNKQLTISFYSEVLTNREVSKNTSLLHGHTDVESFRPNHESVRFNLDLNEEYPITPYSEVYGMHPRFFEFDSEGAMTPTRDFYESQKAVALSAFSNRSICASTLCVGGPPPSSSPYSAGLASGFRQVPVDPTLCCTVLAIPEQ